MGNRKFIMGYFPNVEPHFPLFIKVYKYRNTFVDFEPLKKENKIYFQYLCEEGFLELTHTLFIKFKQNPDSQL